MFICPLLSALKVKLTCLPYRPCRGGNEAEGGSGNPQNSGDRRNCDPLEAQERVKWEQVCTKVDPERASRGGNKEREHSWFRCETDVDLAEVHTNISPSGTSPVPASDLKLKPSVYWSFCVNWVHSHCCWVVGGNQSVCRGSTQSGTRCRTFVPFSQLMVD